MQRHLLFVVLLACSASPLPIVQPIQPIQPVQPVQSEGAEAPTESTSSVASGTDSAFGSLEASSDSEVPATSEPTVGGALSRDQILTVVRAHVREVRHCYERSLVNDPQLQGRVMMKFEISATGAVSRVEVESMTLDDDNVKSCLVRVIQRWTFPEPTGGGVVVVRYPFIFRT